MVTTTASSSREALRLFREAAVSASAAIAATDAFEEEVNAFSVDVLLVAVRTITPALSLVDTPLRSTLGEIRGIRMHSSISPSGLALSRQGRIYNTWQDSLPDDKRSVEQDHEEACRSFLLKYYTLEERVDLLMQLQKVFATAMAANEKRHAKMQELLVRLQAAGAALSSTPAT